MERFPSRRRLLLYLSAPVVLLGVLLWVGPVLAQVVDGRADYRGLFNWDSRTILWIVAELHLMFAAFVLGVPVFAVIVEIIGVRKKDARYDDMAKEFTKLLSSAFATTASLGGLLAFLLYGLYPGFMHYLTGVFHQTMYFYALLFFGEAFTLYYYYYSWDRLKERKGLHITMGVLLNVFGTMLVLVANSWASFMMSPTGIDEKNFSFVGSTWEALTNPLWMPLNIHRLLANVAFGGFIVGAYAAIKLLNTQDTEERAHYDWMGYTGNLVAILALIPLPFAGYYLGREVYSASPVMGNNMMGGSFSWSFIMQAIMVGMLFVTANYYFWTGMQRIEGAERYTKYVKYLNIVILVSFAIWLTPHNLPLSAAEQVRIGGQYHPLLKYLGLMPAKNAVVNLIILSTFFSFIIYRRANKGQTVPVSRQGLLPKVVLPIIGALSILMLLWYALSLFNLDPASLDLSPEKKKYFLFPGYLLVAQMVAVAVTIVFSLLNRGRVAQSLLVFFTAVLVAVVLGVYGFVVMEKANPFLRNIAVVQVLLVFSCLIVALTVDVFIFRGATHVGRILWGNVPARSQYALILLCVTIVMTMALMGFIRSGLREDWHIYGVLRDTSPWGFTPTLAYAGKMVGLISGVFLALITFVFWLGGQTEKRIVRSRGGI